MKCRILFGAPAALCAGVALLGATTESVHAGGFDVAIVAAAATSPTDPRFTDPRDKLMGTGLFNSVTIINANTTTPTLADLQQFHAVLTWSNFDYANPIALGNVFADYVDAGGGVVVATFANSSTGANRFLSGRWITDGYEIIPSQSGNITGTATLGNVLLPGHPIMDGVGSFNGGTSSFRPNTTALTAHGIKVAEWSDGRTLVATSSLFPNRADLGMYPVSADALASGWVTSTDGALLMANALLYTIPTPGAAALLAIGALAGARRRR
ncbi:MAG: PEP-CTERM sorting domain-containing protein [Phycisphaerales bacterium]|jgi:hypothetical protein|nr:MAG: PEP-CTERM sorting domain-containing protein [Phycisphaerales bacterium]